MVGSKTKRGVGGGGRLERIRGSHRRVGGGGRGEGMIRSRLQSVRRG